MVSDLRKPVLLNIAKQMRTLTKDINKSLFLLCYKPTQFRTEINTFSTSFQLQLSLVTSQLVKHASLLAHMYSSRGYELEGIATIIYKVHATERKAHPSLFFNRSLGT